MRENLTVCESVEKMREKSVGKFPAIFQHFRPSLKTVNMTKKFLKMLRSVGLRPPSLHFRKKCGKIQNVVSSSDFEIFPPEMHALAF